MQVRAWVGQHSALLRKVATLCLVAVPYTQIGVARASGSLGALSPGALAQLALVIFAALAAMRALNIACVHLFRFGSRQPDPDAIKRAVVLAGSQKTLPISVTVLLQLADATGLDAGLATLPCVFAHLSQVLIDSVLVSVRRRANPSLDALVRGANFGTACDVCHLCRLRRTSWPAPSASRVKVLLLLL